MEHKLERENRQLKLEISELKLNLAHWQLRAILGSADYERMQNAEDEYKKLIEIVEEGKANNDFSLADINVINKAIAVLDDLSYF